MVLTLAGLAAVVAAVFVATAATAKSSGLALKGAGSSFVSPLVLTLVQPYEAATGVHVDYNPIGSGGGIAAISARTVDFGASDAPLSQFNPTCSSCVQIPWALAATGVVYNLPSFANLKMSGSVLAQIYMGKITKWNAKAIKKLNKGKNLPDKSITVVHRSDGSGTTFNFTDYLSSVSHSWKSQVGTGTSVAWPAGEGEPKSAGVAGAVRTTPGAIGYVDVYYAVHNHLGMFKMKNRSGRFVRPLAKGIIAAAQLDTHPAKDGSLSIVNPPKSRKYWNAYPICTYTYVDVQKSSGAKAGDLKKLISWAITKGQKFGPALIFEPIPKPVVTFDKKQIKKIHS
jgi:phosphate transport system substrate-binding protein